MPCCRNTRIHQVQPQHSHLSSPCGYPKSCFFPANRCIPTCPTVPIVPIPPTPPTVMLFGRITGLPNTSGLEIQYTVNGVRGSTRTDAAGGYQIFAPAGATVVIFPPNAAGFTAFPASQTIVNAQGSQSLTPFTFTPLSLVLTLQRATAVQAPYNQPPVSWPKGGAGPNLFMADRILITVANQLPVQVKWDVGIHNAAYFAANGIDITQTYTGGIPVDSNGAYTVYARGSDGAEQVQTILITGIRDGSVGAPILLIDFATAAALSAAVPGIGQFTLFYTKGGMAQLALSYELYEDINMAGQTWTPIGRDLGTPFSGVMDGNGHAIRNLTVNVLSGEGGLMVATSGAQLLNLGLDNANIIGSHGNGGFIFWAQNGTVMRSCYFRGSITSVTTAGGLIYRTEGGTLIERSFCTATATSASLNGISNLIEDGSIVRDCYASGNLRNGAGLVQTVTNSTLERCYACAQGTIALIQTAGGNVNSFITGNYELDPAQPPFVQTAEPTAVFSNNFTLRPADPHAQQITPAVATNKLLNIYASQTQWDFTSIWTFDYTGYNVVTTPGIETNLPILRGLPNALQSPHLDVV